MILSRLSLFIYAISYLIVISVSIAVFYIFKPYKYVENFKSYITCSKNNNTYQIGPNFIFSFDGKLDWYNDKKARKLCEYAIIRDYGDTFKTPAVINYKFTPVYEQESSLANALLAFFLTFSLGSLVIEIIRKMFFLTLGKNINARNEYNVGSNIFRFFVYLIT